jgi:hypothetical protein
MGVGRGFAICLERWGKGWGSGFLGVVFGAARLGEVTMMEGVVVFTFVIPAQADI